MLESFRNNGDIYISEINLSSVAITALLVWPQWWSWAYVSQQGVDFSKKISKIKMIFWFDFHRCSHGPSKIRHHFRNKSRQFLTYQKMYFTKKSGPKLIFFNEISFRKIWTFFDIEKWLSKSIFTVKNFTNLSDFS